MRRCGSEVPAGYQRLCRIQRELQSPQMIFGLRRKQWSMERNSSRWTDTSKKLMGWSIQSPDLSVGAKGLPPTASSHFDSKPLLFRKQTPLHRIYLSGRRFKQQMITGVHQTECMNNWIVSFCLLFCHHEGHEEKEENFKAYCFVILRAFYGTSINK